MKRTTKLKIYSLLTITLSWATFVSVMMDSIPPYFPMTLVVLLIGSSFFLINEIDRLYKKFLEEKELPPLDLPVNEENKSEEEANKIRKGSFILQKHILTLLEANLTSKKEMEEGFSLLHEAVLKSIKASIRYDRDNTTQIINALHDSKVSQSSQQNDNETEQKMLSLLSQIAENTATEKKLLEELSSKLEQIASRPVMVEVPSHQTAAEPTVEEVKMEVIPETEPEIVAEEPSATAPEIEPETAPEIKEAPVIEPIPELEIEAASEPESAPALEVTDPNKPMSPDEIAALFAASAPEPEIEPETAPEIKEAPALEVTDPNKPMSPDEIAALFAASAPEPEPVPEPAPAPALEVTDPNKPMSPDEIAALFAASAPEPEPVPEPAPAPALEVTDPNKPMSPDEIAALINSLGV